MYSNRYHAAKRQALRLNVFNPSAGNTDEVAALRRAEPGRRIRTGAGAVQPGRRRARRIRPAGLRGRGLEAPTLPSPPSHKAGAPPDSFSGSRGRGGGV